MAMQILSALYSLIFGPLETVFEIIFSILNKNIRSAGVSVIFLSLAFSLLVLPLYRRADRIQEETRIKEEKLKPILEEAIQKIVVSRVAGSEAGDPSMHTIMTLTMACQMLWNELEDLKEVVAKAKQL